jgi:hypothetical protein
VRRRPFQIQISNEARCAIALAQEAIEMLNLSRRGRCAIGVAAALAMLFGAAQPAQANHSVWNNSRFPEHFSGFLWMSGWKNYTGFLFVESNQPKGCLPWEQDRPHEVWGNIGNSTWGQSSMNRWVNGVQMSNNGCNGTLSSDGAAFTYSNYNMDTAIGWDLNTGHFAGIGGRVRHQEAGPTFCAANGVNYPCGSRGWVQINWNKWVGQGGFPAVSDNYRRREILHETGHAHGLIDCPSNYYGMMMNGTCGWDETITQWNADDRASVSSIYP